MKYLLQVILLSCIVACSDKAGPLTPPPPTPGVNTSELALTVVSDNIDADGVRHAEILLKAGPTILARYREANLDISPFGKFNNGATTQKVTIDINGEARIFVNSTNPGVATVKATIDYFARQVVVHFLPSYPDQLFIEPDSSALMPLIGAKTNIKARLVRVNGQVTSGHTVNFYDSTAINTSIGVFLNTSLSNSAGLATTDYWIQDTSYHGFVYIKGYVMNGSTKVRGVNTIRVR